MLTLRRILCPIDFSESSRLALTYASALSTWYEAPLTLFHVCVDLPVFEIGVYSIRISLKKFCLLLPQ